MPDIAELHTEIALSNEVSGRGGHKGKGNAVVGFKLPDTDFKLCDLVLQTIDSGRPPSEAQIARSVAQASFAERVSLYRSVKIANQLEAILGELNQGAAAKARLRLTLLLSC